MSKIAELLKQHQGLSDEDINEIKSNVPLPQQAISRQGDAVLLFLESPAKFTTKTCKRCGEIFGTNYRGVSYCSDRCRAASMEEQLGIKWNWMKPDEDRWGGEPPLIIPPLALQKLKQFVEFFAGMPHIQTEREKPLDQEYQQLVQEELQLQQLQSEASTNNVLYSPETTLLDSNQQLSQAEESPFDFE
jgi:hypothetical protein